MQQAKRISSSELVVQRDGVELHLGDALDRYETWPAPTVLISDGPYGLRSYPGDPPTVESLAEWYRPHVEAWSKFALPSATLWFWNSELGWATTHPVLLANGWEYRGCHVWNKGLAHVAGNANSKTLRKLPVVTEVCVQYVRVVRLPSPASAEPLPLKEWVRAEWERTRLPFNLTNEACGVANAATRKYFTKDHLWYFPPAPMFEKLASYANANGAVTRWPYFSADGRRPLTGGEWEALRAKFYCPVGWNNVWNEPPVNGRERIKNGNRRLHANQKPLKLNELIIGVSSDPGDVVWEPFGGTATGTIAALRLGREGRCAEVLPEFYHMAAHRLMAEDDGGRSSSSRS